MENAPETNPAERVPEEAYTALHEKLRAETHSHRDMTETIVAQHELFVSQEPHAGRLGLEEARMLALSDQKSHEGIELTKRQTALMSYRDILISPNTSLEQAQQAREKLEALGVTPTQREHVAFASGMHRTDHVLARHFGIDTPHYTAPETFDEPPQGNVKERDTSDIGTPPEWLSTQLQKSPQPEMGASVMAQFGAIAYPIKQREETPDNYLSETEIQLAMTIAGTVDKSAYCVADHGIELKKALGDQPEEKVTHVQEGTWREILSGRERAIANYTEAIASETSTPEQIAEARRELGSAGLSEAQREHLALVVAISPLHAALTKHYGLEPTTTT